MPDDIAGDAQAQAVYRVMLRPITRMAGALTFPRGQRTGHARWFEAGEAG